VPLEIAGRHEDAQAVFDNLQLLYYNQGNLIGIGQWMLLREQPEEFIAFLEEQAADSDDWIAAQPRPEELWGAAHLTNVAYALQVIGRDTEAQRVMTLARETLDAQARNGADNLFYWWNEAEYAALAGDVDAMRANLRQAIDAGSYDVAGFYTAPFNRYRGDPGFIELENEAIRRANAERRKLGLLPVASFIHKKTQLVARGGQNRRERFWTHAVRPKGERHGWRESINHRHEDFQ
jgi:hypothetical protein